MPGMRRRDFVSLLGGTALRGRSLRTRRMREPADDRFPGGEHTLSMRSNGLLPSAATAPAGWTEGRQLRSDVAGQKDIANVTPISPPSSFG